MRSAVIKFAHGIFIHPAFFENAERKTFPYFFALKFVVFLVKMSTSDCLRCYNKGCGKEYREEENGEGDYCRQFIVSFNNLVQFHAVTQILGG